MSLRVLTVCYGNICRSPLAAAVLRKQATALGVDITIESAGLGGWHIGQGADRRAVVAGRGHALDLSSHTARLLDKSDFDQFDHILVMDRENYEQIEELAPAGGMSKVSYLTSYGPEPEKIDVPDPYYTGRFEPVIAQLEACIDGFLAQATGEQ